MSIGQPSFAHCHERGYLYQNPHHRHTHDNINSLYNNLAHLYKTHHVSPLDLALRHWCEQETPHRISSLPLATTQ